MKTSNTDHILMLPSSDTLCKGKGNRDGLVQQIITYVRNGRTITRKQWVRSEFADHAKKNEEEKKKTLLRQAAKEEKKHEKDVQEGNEKKDIEDRKAERKKLSEEMETLKKQGKLSDSALKELHGKLKESLKQDQDRKQSQSSDSAKKKAEKDSKSNNKDKKSAYGQQDSSKETNKNEENIATQYTPPSDTNNKNNKLS